MERTVLIELPIGALQEISKGRVGLVAWTGVYIRFKPERRLEETPFDVKDWEAAVIMRFFHYIIGGEADRDIATIKGITPKEAPTIKVVRCPHCGAPYTKEIYKGQTSVQCEYCRTSIIISLKPRTRTFSSLLCLRAPIASALDINSQILEE